MIELIAIYLISKNIAGIAQEKGYSKGLWRFLTILSWVICEIIGIIFGLIVFGLKGGFLIYICAIIGALLGVFIVRKIIDGKPDLTKNTDSIIEE